MARPTKELEHTTEDWKQAYDYHMMGLSSRDIATKMGVSHKTINEWRVKYEAEMLSVYNTHHLNFLSLHTLNRGREKLEMEYAKANDPNLRVKIMNAITRIVEVIDKREGLNKQPDVVHNVQIVQIQPLDYSHKELIEAKLASNTRDLPA